MGWTEQVHTKKLCGNRISCTCLWNRCKYRYRNSGRGKNCEMFNSLNWFQQVTFTFKIKFTGKCFSLKSIQGIPGIFPARIPVPVPILVPVPKTSARYPVPAQFLGICSVQPLCLGCHKSLRSLKTHLSLTACILTRVQWKCAVFVITFTNLKCIVWPTKVFARRAANVFLPIKATWQRTI